MTRKRITTAAEAIAAAHREVERDRLINSLLEKIQYMKVRINIMIDAHPGQGYGSMQFSEEAEFQRADFEICSKVFTRAHDLLAALKSEIEPALKR